MTKYSDQQVRELRERVAAGEPQISVARSMGMTARYAWTLVWGRKRPEAGGPMKTRTA